MCLSTGLGPQNRIAFSALHVVSTSLKQHFPFCSILGCGKGLFSALCACSACSVLSCKLVPYAGYSCAFAGSLVAADCCWPQLSFPLRVNVKWMLSEQPFLMQAKEKKIFFWFILDHTVFQIHYLTSTSLVGIHPFCHVQYMDPHYSYEDRCTAFLFIHLPSTQSSLNDLQCVPAVLGPPFVCVVSSELRAGEKKIITQMWYKCQL